MANEFYDLFYQLFYSTDVWGYLGIVAVVMLAVMSVRERKELTPLGFLLCGYMGVDYLMRVTETGTYVLHGIIGLFGAIFIAIMGLHAFTDSR